MKSLYKTIFNSTLLFSAVMALGLFPVQVSAQGGPPPNSGPIAFSDFDADGNGEVDEAEFNQARTERMADNAADGRPMKNAANMTAFEIIDTDGNGTLSETEILVFQTEQRSAMQDQAGGMGHGKGQGMGMGSGKGQGMKKGMHMPSFSDIDTDGNGCISPDELTAHQQAMHPASSSD